MNDLEQLNEKLDLLINGLGLQAKEEKQKQTKKEKAQERFHRFLRTKFKQKNLTV